MITRQCIVLHPRFGSGISRYFTSNLLLLLLLLLFLDCLPFLLRTTHLVLQLLDLPHLGVDQQVIRRLLLLRELHHKLERKAQLGSSFTSASQLVQCQVDLKQAEVQCSMLAGSSGGAGLQQAGREGS